MAGGGGVSHPLPQTHKGGRMPSIAYRIAHRRVLVVEEVVEEWQIDHEQAKLACDTDELVRETADLRKPMERLVSHLNTDAAKEGLRDDDLSKLFVLAHLVASLLNKTLDLFPKVHALADGVRRWGYS